MSDPLKMVRKVHFGLQLAGRNLLGCSSLVDAMDRMQLGQEEEMDNPNTFRVTERSPTNSGACLSPYPFGGNRIVQRRGEGNLQAVLKPVTSPFCLLLILVQQRLNPHVEILGFCVVVVVWLGQECV